MTCSLYEGDNSGGGRGVNPYLPLFGSPYPKMTTFPQKCNLINDYYFFSQPKPLFDFFFKVT